MTDLIRLLLGPARAAYVGPSLDLAPHSNLATTLVFALDHPASLRIWSPGRGWGEWRTQQVAVIPTATLHHLRASGRMVFLYLDPLSDDISNLQEARVMHARQTLASTDTEELSIDTIVKMIGIKPKHPTHKRMERVLQAIERQPEEFECIEDAARLAHLSASRFRAVFAEHVGLPFRRYRLWRKMARVVSLVSEGRNLTDAALDAGFTDSAHLSTTFKRMFGISPGFLLDPRVTIVCEPVLTLDAMRAA
jgi:AraC-like DNA-binding protein